MPSLVDLGRRSLRYYITYPKSQVAHVTITGTDTDYLVKYEFINSRCWYLNRIDDFSL